MALPDRKLLLRMARQAKVLAEKARRAQEGMDDADRLVYSHTTDSLNMVAAHLDSAWDELEEAEYGLRRPGEKLLTEAMFEVLEKEED